MKKLLSILCAILTTLILFTFIACKPAEEEEKNESGFRALTFEEMYFNAEYYSFANLKIDSVDSEEYCEAGINISGEPYKVKNSTKRFSVLECTVEADFFGRLEPGKTVYLAILKEVDDSNNYKEEFKNLFCKGQNIIAHFRSNIDNVLASSETDEIRSFPYLSTQMDLSGWDIIPFNGNKIDLNSMRTFMDEQKISYISYIFNRGFTNYVNNGMTLEEVSENLKNYADSLK